MEAKSKKYVRLVVGVVLAVLWMVFIFAMSAKVADDSDALSNGLIERVLTLVIGGSDPQLVASLSFPVRKLAHFSEYAVLGVLLANVARTVGLLRAGEACSLLRRLGLVSWVTGTLYAASDEFHQAFVPGRSPQVTDVLIDSSGVALGVVLFLLVIKGLAGQKR